MRNSRDGKTSRQRRALQGASLLIAVVGVLLLCAHAVHREIPGVRMGDITPAMDFSTVRISGYVMDQPIVSTSGDVAFHLQDASEKLSVWGSRSQAEELRNNNQLPRRGDQVELVGILSLREGQEAKLRLQSIEELTRLPSSISHISPSASRIRLVDLAPTKKGERVSVVGTLKEIIIPGPRSKKPYVLILTEDDAEVPVVFWDPVFQGLERKLPIPGKLLRVSGRAEMYKGTLQLKLLDSEDLCEVTERALLDLRVEQPICPIADITAEQEGALFTVVGVLGEPKSIRGGVLYPLSDSSGEILVLFWDSKVSGEERDALESGIHLRITAPLVVYKGKLELIPENADSFWVD